MFHRVGEVFAWALTNAQNVGMLTLGGKSRSRREKVGQSFFVKRGIMMKRIVWRLGSIVLAALLLLSLAACGMRREIVISSEAEAPTFRSSTDGARSVAQKLGVAQCGCEKDVGGLRHEKGRPGGRQSQIDL